MKRNISFIYSIEVYPGMFAEASIKTSNRLISAIIGLYRLLYTHPYFYSESSKKKREEKIGVITAALD